MLMLITFDSHVLFLKEIIGHLANQITNKPNSNLTFNLKMSGGKKRERTRVNGIRRDRKDRITEKKKWYNRKNFHLRRRKQWSEREKTREWAREKEAAPWESTSEDSREIEVPGRDSWKPIEFGIAVPLQKVHSDSADERSPVRRRDACKVVLPTYTHLGR